MHNIGNHPGIAPRTFKTFCSYLNVNRNDGISSFDMCLVAHFEDSITAKRGKRGDVQAAIPRDALLVEGVEILDARAPVLLL